MTQGDLARMCRIKQAYISQIENNKKEPNLSTIKSISMALGTPLPVIFLLSLEKIDVPRNKQTIFDAMKPSIAGFFKSIYDDEATQNYK